MYVNAAVLTLVYAKHQRGIMVFLLGTAKKTLKTKIGVTNMNELILICVLIFAIAVVVIAGLVTGQWFDKIENDAKREHELLKQSREVKVGCSGPVDPDRVCEWEVQYDTRKYQTGCGNEASCLGTFTSYCQFCGGRIIT